MFPLAADTTPWRKLPIEGVRTITVEGKTVLRIAPEALSELAVRAFHDVSHLLRPAHLASLRAILDDPEASSNDRFVALDLLKNANIAAGGVLPMCQDTGTAIVFGKKGQRVWVDGDEEEALSWGVHRTYTETNLRYSQMAPLSMFEEVNTGNNLPVQFDIMAAPGEHHADEFHLMFVAKGGGSANKTFLFQETRAILSPAAAGEVPRNQDEDAGDLGLPAVSSGDRHRRHLGRTDAEDGEAGLDEMAGRVADQRQQGRPCVPRSRHWNGRSWRSPATSASARSSAANTSAMTCGWCGCRGTAPRCRSASASPAAPTGRSWPRSRPRACSWSSWKPIRRSICRRRPTPISATTRCAIDLNRPMAEIRAELTRYPVKTRLSLTGTMVVARDIAHAKLKERLDNGLPLPDYLKNHPVYYAGPAKTPTGMATGSFGPTTAGRMDSYVAEFQAAGGSLVMLAKGNRSKAVKDACRAHGGFYLGSVGGPAARLAQDCIRKVEVLEFPELGMEAVWRIEVENFPAFIVMDDKGNDFYDGLG